MFRLLALRQRRQSSTLLLRVVQRPLVTSKQKRALQESQIHGGDSTSVGKSTNTAAGGVSPPPPPPTTTKTTTPSTSSPWKRGDRVAGSVVGPFALAVGVGAAGVYYYFTTVRTPREQPSTGSAAVDESIESSVTTTPVENKTTTASSLSKDEVKSGSTTSKDDKASLTAEQEQPMPAEPQQRETSSSSGNRVSQIPVSSKMRNAAGSSSDTTAAAATTTAIAEVDHPEAGHRVTTLPPKPKDPPIDTSMTDAAIAALQSETLIKTAQSLIESHTTLASTTIQELDQMQNISQLKAKILQLTSELQDRTKWEAVRLKEFLVMKEKEVAEKYLAIVQKQRLEMEDLLAKRLREQEHEMATMAQRALQEKENGIQSVVQAALAAQETEHEADKKAYQEIVNAELQASFKESLAKQVEEIRKEHVAKLEQKLNELKALSGKLRHLELALSASLANREGSLKAHRLSAAALALSEKLETSQSAATELAALQRAAGTEGVIATACATIPQSVVRTGVPTLAELQARFEKVAKKCRQALLVPNGILGLEGQLAGMVMAAVTYPPTTDAEGDTAEHKLERARAMLAEGLLEDAIGQLEMLPGQANFVVQDWLRSAIERVAVEKALKVIKLECTLLNESCLEDNNNNSNDESNNNNTP